MWAQTQLHTALALAAECRAKGNSWPADMFPKKSKERPAHMAGMDRYIRRDPYAKGSERYVQIRDAYSRWLTEDCRPFSTVELESFRAAMRVLDARTPNFWHSTLIAQVHTHTMLLLVCFGSCGLRSTNLH